MYVNPHFAESDLAFLHDAIEETRFGLLVLCANGVLAAHIPFVLHREQGARGTLEAHVARNDPLARHLGSAPEALAIFSGPHAYISPDWCPGGGLPTYNFLAVHARGRARALEDPNQVLAHLGELVDVHERRSQRPWSLACASRGDVAALLPHVAAFTLAIDELQGKRKLSQNRTAEDRDGVISGLRRRATDDDRAIADAMSAYPYSSEHAQPLLTPPRARRECDDRPG